MPLRRLTRSAVSMLILPLVLHGSADRQPRDTPPVRAAAAVPHPFEHLSVGAPTHVVDNTHPFATDRDNPRGSTSRPRLTIPASLSSGDVVVVSGGPYVLTSRETSWRANGSAERPAVIRGIGKPVVQGSASQLTLGGTHLVIDGLVFDSVRLRAAAEGLRHFLLQDSEVRNWTGRATALIAFGTSAAGQPNEYLVISGNQLHDLGRMDTGGEEDTHGIVVTTGMRHVWITGNTISRTAGDAVRVGTNPPAPEPMAEHVYITGNRLFETGENAVDVKQCRNLLIAGNEMYGFRPPRSGSAHGEAVVIHYGPRNVWLVNNRIHESARGIVSTDADGLYIVGNLIYKIHDDEGGSRQGRFSAGHGIALRSTANAHVVHNTIWDVDAGVATVNDGATIVNNILGEVRPGGHHLGFGDEKAARGSRLLGNLISGRVVSRFGSRAVDGLPDLSARVGADAGNSTGPAAFEPPGFALSAASTARDSGHGAGEEVVARFRELFPRGASINIDINGTPRPQGGRADRGALERPVR